MHCANLLIQKFVLSSPEFSFVRFPCIVLFMASLHADVCVWDQGVGAVCGPSD